MADSNIIPIKSLSSLPAMSGLFGYVEGDLTEGAALGFPVLSYRGKVWRLVHKGNENKLMTPEGDPIPSVRVVILRANSNLSKIFYAKKYTEGDSEAPDCFSLDGITPDSSVKSPQCKTCGGCEQAAWGSRVSDEGKDLKACQDSRRLVVVPANDVANDAMGGPMLLRVPAASLGNLVAYDDRLKQAGAAYFGVATKISFDTDAAYPKLVFDYDHPASEKLTSADGEQILQMRDGDAAQRILQTMSKTEHGAGEAPAPVQTPAAPPVSKPPVQEVVEPTPETTPAPVTEPPPSEPAATVSEVAPSADVDSLVAGLLS